MAWGYGISQRIWQTDISFQTVGHWWTTIPNEMSVCQVQMPARTVEAGPIWNQEHAEQVCPAIALSHGAEWTGHWWTTVWNEMSVCQIR